MSRCVKLVVRHKPTNLKIGPFCPATLKDKGGLYRIDEKFLTMLQAQGYQFFDADGKVRTHHRRPHDAAWRQEFMPVGLRG